MRRQLIAGNWKMNGSLAANTVLLEGIKAGLSASECDVAVCAPAIYLAQCRAELAGSSVRWGGQDVSVHASGAYTGEISGQMLADFGCSYVIVGHSERRTYHAENDEEVAAKSRRALQSGLVPIVCVGETLAEREAGQGEAVVTRQVDAVLAELEADEASRIVIAYEPVWAIGTGRTATPAMAQEIHSVLRERLHAKTDAADLVRILYGGSMKPDNARELLSMPDIDGGLIGGASLNAADFLAIVASTHK